jgi:hypothetical protein
MIVARNQPIRHFGPPQLNRTAKVYHILHRGERTKTTLMRELSH